MFQQTPQKRVLFPRGLKQVRSGGFVVFGLLLVFVTALLTSIFAPSRPALAATNNTLSFQARLMTNAGAIVPDGTYNVQFKLYTGGTAGGPAGVGQANAGTNLWTETWYDSNGATAGNDARVTVRNGYLSVNLGSQTAFPANLNWDQELWISLNIGGMDQTNTPTWDGEMNPRLKLTGTPYAFRAGQLATAHTSNGFTSTLSLLQPTVGNQTFQIQDQGAAGTYTLCVQNSTACGFAPASGSANYIQNQNTSQQVSTNFWLSGTGRADTALQAPSFDTATAVALNIGTTNATSITLGKVGVNTRVAGNLSVGTTQNFGAITVANGAWFTAVDASGTGAINMFQVNSQNQIQVGAALNIDGGIVLPTNGGQMTLVDLGVDATASAGSKQSYTLRVGSTNALTVYGEADGAGNAQNVRVAVGSSINPGYTLDVGGDINTSGVFRINGQQICSSAGCTTSSGSGNYIQNQNTSQQSTSNFWISGTGRADTALQAPALDTAAAGTLSIGTTNATAITLGKAGVATTVAGSLNTQSVSVAAGQSITLVGGITSTRPASPTAGMLYFDQTTGQLLTYTGSKWQADRSSNTVVVGTSASGGTSSAVASKSPDGAEFINTSTTSAQTTIASAIAALPSSGGTVYLMEGTYVIDAAISIPNNVSLVGAGVGSTIIKLKNAINANINAITNTDTSTGSNIRLAQLTLNGNKANNSSGTQNGVYGNTLGAGQLNGLHADNISVINFRASALSLVNGGNAKILDSTFRGNTGTAIELNFNANSVISNNQIDDNGGVGISLVLTTGSIVSDNVVSNNALSGIYLNFFASNNVVTGNRIVNSGGAIDNGAIIVQADSDNNVITSNLISDASATATNIAIAIENNTSDNNYLANNTLGGGATSDSGTGTRYANQLDVYGNSINQALGALVSRLQSSSSSDLFQAQNSSGTTLMRVTSTGIVQAPTFDTATAAALNIGTTNATAINLNQNVTVAAGKTITMVGGATNLRPAVPAEGMIYFDSQTNELLVYANGSWQPLNGGSGGLDGRTATMIVAASNSPQAAKDAADYVADGTGDQTEINAALTAAAGGVVYLVKGTYVASDTIQIPNNTTLAGEGASTIIELADIDITKRLIENQDQSTAGAGVVIRDISLDGNNDLNTAGTQTGIYLSGMGSAGTTGRTGAKISSVIVKNFRTNGIYVTASAGTTITNSTLTANDSFGIFIGSSSEVVASNNTVYGSSNGISTGVSSTNITIEGNSVSGATNGIYVISSASSVVISGNTIANATQLGIFADTSSDLSIVGNVITSAGQRAINIQTVTNSTITGNTIKASAGIGIRISSSNNNVVSSNKIHDSGGAGLNDGIAFASADLNTVTNNNITDSSATTNNYAINIANSASDNNYLADNTLGTGSINDLGTGTRYASQSDANGNSINQSSGSLVSRLQSGSSADLFQAQNSSSVAVMKVTSTGIVQSSGFDTLSASALSIGTANASSINIGKTSSNIQTTVTGTAVFKPSTGNDSATAFQIQNAAGTALFNVNSSNGTITIGSGADRIELSSTGITAFGTARQLKSTKLAAEYPNSVLDAASDSACVSANNGTMTSGYDGVNRMNYYNWTSSSATDQCYDVVVQYTIPSDYESWFLDPLNIQAKTDNTSNSSVSIHVLDSFGNTDSFYNYSSYIPGTSWADIAPHGLGTGTTFGVNQTITLRIRMTAKNNANVKIGNITFNYNGNK